MAATPPFKDLHEVAWRIVSNVDGTVAYVIDEHGLVVMSLQQLLGLQEGDQIIHSHDPSFLRQGTLSLLASGALYTVLGNNAAMHYLMHNAAINALTGAWLGRDDAGPCTGLVYAEDETLHGIGAATGAAGTVPSFAQTSFWNLLTGQFGGASFAAGFRASVMPGNVDTVAVTDCAMTLTPTAAAVLTLPAASAANKGQPIELVLQAAFAVTSASANVIPLAGGAAGTALFSAATAGKYVVLRSTGAAWQIMQAN